jgi:hypothetical protein
MHYECVHTEMVHPFQGLGHSNEIPREYRLTPLSRDTKPASGKFTCHHRGDWSKKEQLSDYTLL